MSYSLSQLVNALIPKASYQEPQELEIGGIKAVLVDPHNEVYPYWMQFKNSLVLHVDAHEDADDGAPLNTGSDNKNYSKQLGIENYLSAAVHYGAVNVVMWMNPYLIDKYRSLIYFARPELGPIQTTEECGKIRWKNFYYYQQECFEAIIDCKYHPHPFILDIDLDAFACLGKKRNRKTQIKERIDHTLSFIGKLRKPDYISIARSQNPRVFVPRRHVDWISEELIDGLNKLYLPG